MPHIHDTVEIYQYRKIYPEAENNYPNYSNKECDTNLHHHLLMK